MSLYAKRAPHEILYTVPLNSALVNKSSNAYYPTEVYRHSARHLRGKLGKTSSAHLLMGEPGKWYKREREGTGCGRAKTTGDAGLSPE